MLSLRKNPPKKEHTYTYTHTKRYLNKLPLLTTTAVGVKINRRIKYKMHCMNLIFVVEIFLRLCLSSMWWYTCQGTNYLIPTKIGVGV